MSVINDTDPIDFGEVPPAVNDILQQGVSLYRQDRAAADDRFMAALAVDPTVLASYYCLYKTLTYRGRLDEALAIADAALAEASRQAGLPADWSQWTRDSVSVAAPGPAHFALYTLKAMAFMHLKRNAPEAGWHCLDKLAALGEIDAVGGNVIAELARAIS